MTQSLFGTLRGVYVAAQTVFAAAKASDGSPVLVSLGDPGQYQPSTIVAVMDAAPSNAVDRPTMGTNRSRELAADISVTFSSYAPGGADAHGTALDTVAQLIPLFEAYFRTSPNETLGGACRDSWVSNIAGPTGTVVYDPNNPDVPTGRVVEATATVTALIRY